MAAAMAMLDCRLQKGLKHGPIADGTLGGWSMEQDYRASSQYVDLPKSGGMPTQGEFRYPGYAVICMRLAIGWPLIFFAAAYYASVNLSTNVSMLLTLFVAPVAICTTFMWLVYLSVKKYCVVVTPSGLAVTYLFSKKNISFSDMSEIQRVEGGRGNAELRMRNHAGKKLLKLNNWVVDFELLVSLLKQNASKFGVRYRQFDHGHWS
jgi:hypothetical protein